MSRNAMRPVVVVALLGTVLSVRSVGAQSTSEEPAAAKAQSKPAQAHVSHHAWLFENGAAPKNPVIVRQAPSHRSSEDAAPDSAPSAPPAAPAPVLPTVQAVPPGPPQKNLTGDEFKLIHVGSTEKQVLEMLGPPSSQIVVPDDDDHLRETLQYWVKGVPMGTVRLDNGRVVEIRTKPK
jgi:hypothetical protein